MYSDKIRTQNIDMDLLGIANMYQVEALQHVCEKQLCNELNVTNVMDAWLGAHFLERYIFLNVCEKFVVENWEDVKKTDSFSKILRENPNAIATLTIKILKQVTI